ncbi:hypothetical protein Patl1_15726 [Pistacia atlantica]|uniref:Uncharacterized protein n=1 Tax=Pistacia atlantica TaxID=434234 RepID=A0ACC1B5T8_9ROSI|nr:hypothetical protein Patl1_15726 [Pistacia atlantica]
MEPWLISNFIRFPTAKAVWDVITITYFDGTDTSQVYDLKRRVIRLRQAGGSIEMYYNGLQSLWREIDFRRPNLMKCENDIQKFNSIIQEDKVYTFLDGEDSRQAIMLTGTDVGAMMASRGGNKPFQPVGVATNGPNRSSQLHQAPSNQAIQHPIYPTHPSLPPISDNRERVHEFNAKEGSAVNEQLVHGQPTRLIQGFSTIIMLKQENQLITNLLAFRGRYM